MATPRDRRAASADSCGRLLEADDGLIHRQAFARNGQQFIDHAVALGLQHVLHFDRLDLGQHFAGLDRHQRQQVGGGAPKARLLGARIDVTL